MGIFSTKEEVRLRLVRIVSDGDYAGVIIEITKQLCDGPYYADIKNTKEVFLNINGREIII